MIKSIHLALSVIGIAFALLGLVVALFAVIVGRQPGIGEAYLAAATLGWAGTIAATGLFAGSVLGTVALVRHTDARRPRYLLAIVSGWIAALVLGWIVWEFWSHASLPQVAA